MLRRKVNLSILHEKTQAKSQFKMLFLYRMFFNH